MIEWPTRVRVGWADYALLPYAAHEATSKGNFGEHNSLTMEMRYDSALSAQRQAHTILHELTHAIRASLWLSGFWETAKAQEPDKAEETIASGIADGFACVIRDNSDLWIALGAALTKEPT